MTTPRVVPITPAIHRIKTGRGVIARFDPPRKPLPVPKIEWATKGAQPPMSLTESGARVCALVNRLHDWWDQCHGRRAPE